MSTVMPATPRTAAPAAPKPPPAWLPGEHFAAALLFLLAGTVSLATFAPLLAGGAFLDPRITATTHLFTLGWITTSIMGALYQFLPVALAQPIRSVPLAHATFLLYVPGLLLFVAGLGTGRHALMLGGAATFGTGVLMFVGNMAATLKRARRRDVTWWSLAFATFYLLVTLLLGIALAGNLRWGYLGGGRLNALGVHLHIALAGWVLLVVIGVARRLLPMFLLTHGVDERRVRFAVAAVATGAGVLSFLHHAPPLLSHWLPAALIASGCGAFLLQARAWYAARRRPALDPGMRLAAGALLMLVLALVLAVPTMLDAGSASIRVGYVTAVLLGITLFVAAHYYKIVPFLVWYHRYGPLVGSRPVATVAELYSARTASIATALLFTGAAMLVLAVLIGAHAAARIAALLLLAGTAVECTQMFMLWRRKP